MSESTASHSNIDTEKVAEMVKKMSDQMETLLGRVEKLDKSDRAMTSRLKKIESVATEGGNAASLVAFEDFDKAFSDSKKSVYKPARVANFTSPVHMVINYKPTEDVVDKVLNRLANKFETYENNKGERIYYEKLVTEQIAKHGITSELREVTKKMNLYKASTLRKAIYSRAYAWALNELFSQYKDRITTMIEDTYGFTQKVISQLESEDEGPITFFAEQSVALTLQRNKL